MWVPEKVDLKLKRQLSLLNKKCRKFKTMKGKEGLEHRLVEGIIIIAGNYPKRSTIK